MWQVTPLFIASWDLDRNAGNSGRVITTVECADGALQPRATRVRERGSVLSLLQLVCPSSDLRLPKASSLEVCHSKCTGRRGGLSQSVVVNGDAECGPDEVNEDFKRPGSTEAGGCIPTQTSPTKPWSEFCEGE